MLSTASHTRQQNRGPSAQAPRRGGRSSGYSRLGRSLNTQSFPDQYSEPLVAGESGLQENDLEMARDQSSANNRSATSTTGTEATGDNTLDTSTYSEYTVNTTMSNNRAGTNTLLQDVALSQEHMESALTVGPASLHEQTKTTIAQEWFWLFVLVSIIYITKPEDALSMVQKCGIDPREEIINFVAWILAPVCLSRALIYAAYRTPRNYQTFLSFSFALSVYYHGTFGFWTLENFTRIVQAPPACGKEPVTILKLIYHVTLIIGAFPAIVFILGAVLFTCFIPWFFYDRYQRSQNMRAQAMKTTEMLQEMFKIKWSAKSLTYQDECCICLGEFKPKQSVVALPCDLKHYFHECCIENWFKYHTACPFCKKDVTLEEIRKTKPSYEQQLKQFTS